MVSDCRCEPASTSDTGSAGPVIHALGVCVRPLERIATAGKILGLTRSTAYRLAEADGWPMAGPESNRRVLMITLLDRYGIPYTIEDSGITDADAVASDCGGCS
ncbi:MAG: hypothetical protein XD74_0859 [Actinobacteria bacterium 66_15]|nr:MAG: hypothetical protein XD74_0859 [Actinobacteria bacterium 66_15]